MNDEVKRLKSIACVDCIVAGRDGVWPIVCMQFDHRNGEEKIDTIGHFIWRGDEAGFKAEVAKCDVICSNCHAIRTNSRAQSHDQKQKARHKKSLKGVMSEIQNRPEVKKKKSASQSIAMKAFHERRKAAGIPWRGSKGK